MKRAKPDSESNNVGGGAAGAISNGGGAAAAAAAALPDRFPWGPVVQSAPKPVYDFSTFNPLALKHAVYFGNRDAVRNYFCNFPYKSYALAGTLQTELAKTGSSLKCSFIHNISRFHCYISAQVNVICVEHCRKLDEDHESETMATWHRYLLGMMSSAFMEFSHDDLNRAKVNFSDINGKILKAMSTPETAGAKIREILKQPRTLLINQRDSKDLQQRG